MSIESFFSDNIKAALKNDPPGEWMTATPDGCIRLNSGYPAPDLVPVQQLKSAVVNLIEKEQDLPFHYLGSPKFAKLKEQIQGRLADRGICISKEELLITSGACQAIDLVARILIDKETFVVIESPTYMEALEVFQNYTQYFISVPVDEYGLKTDCLAEMLEERKRQGQTLPRLLYTIPTHQNPTGTTMTRDRRQHLVELAIKYNFLILEDDAYGELSFNKSPIPLMAIDQEDRVIHVGSLSKVVAPGLRIGWVAGAKELITAITWLKKDLDHPFAQATMATYLENINFEERLKILRTKYHTKCTVLISALEQYFPGSVSWYVPEGGYFAWVRIPGVDTSQLLTQALTEGVSFVPGKHFFLDQKNGTEFLRLSFSYADEKEIVEGIQKLGKVVTSNF
ncbi:PLP-dependent aminotransferase family protein [Alkalihalobacterium alkalinitrilicum]|uniref:aminotransferase-like domain-containing protein n=1 Tax=Alkalihalobacterium alkalinitrilicum TaxID=427920 RepID=UPI0009957FE8|nr:PLP-dependent aminotransferase family protein [Alkalihalobacterium alkalinitrilicum]